jgi:diphthamide biosynthesis protein 2
MRSIAIARQKPQGQGQLRGSSNRALVKRANSGVAAIGSVASPGAEYQRSQRTWQGLDTDYREEEEEGRVNRHAAKMEEGRSGIARGYVVGDEGRKH